MLITKAKIITKKIILNKLFKTIVICIVLFNILFASVLSSFAVPVADMSKVSVPLNVERAGNYVSNFAINFETNFGKKASYSDVTTEVGDTYNGNDVSGKYCFNTSSWIGFVFNQSLKLSSNSEVPSMSASNYVTPHTKTEKASWNENFFSQLKFNGDAYALDENDKEKKTENLNIASIATNDEIQPGDVLIKAKYTKPKDGETDKEYQGQVFLYIGAGQVIYCRQPVDNKDKVVLERCFIDDLDCKIDTVIRMKEEVAEKILDTDATMIFAGKSYDPGITYQGIPGFGTYLGTTTFDDVLKWIVDSLKNIADVLIGILTYAVRAILIGWTNLVENLVHDTLLGSAEDTSTGKNTPTVINKVVSSPNGSYVNSLTGKANNLDTRISIEQIIFNKIPILDVNFFGVDKAGGFEIAEGSIVYMIRSNIANWYYIIRLISLVVMLLVLIYVGIRIAITTTGQRKAQYKSALTGWVVGMIAVIAVHLFMYLIFELNEYIIAIFEKTAVAMNGGEFSIYETIRTKSYAPRFTEGFGSTIIYMVLVYTLIRFAFIYFKRYLTVTILGLLGPVVGLRYAVERATGRKTKSISNWMFEFAMNVLLQSVHALLYVVLMQIAITMAFKSLSGFVVALVILGFMLKADKIFMKIFNFDRSKSVGDTAQPEGLLQQFAKYTWGAKLTATAFQKLGKGALGFGKGTIHFAEDVGDIWHDGREEGDTKKKWQSNLYKGLGATGRFMAGEKGIKPIRWVNSRLGGKISSIAALSLLQGTKESKKMDKAAIDALKLNWKLSQKSYTRTVKAVKASVGSAFKLATAIPIGVSDPMAGVGLAASAVSGIIHNTDRTAIKNKQLEEDYQDYLEHKEDSKGKKFARGAVHAAAGAVVGPATLSGDIASFGARGITKSAIFDIEKYEDERMKNHKIIENLKKADITEKEIDKLYKELQTEIKKTNSGLTNEELKKKLNKEFSSTAKEALTKRVGSSTVKDAVNEYMKINDLRQLSEVDIDNIMDMIKRKEFESGKKIVFDSDVLDNVRESLQQVIDEKASKRAKKIILAEDMQGAFKKGLAKSGSIKSDKVDSSVPNKTEEIKTQLQEKVREYENLHEGSGKKVEETKSMLRRVRDNDKGNN